MYAFVDQPVASLCNSGRFLLWAMRGWNHAAGRATCPPLLLRQGFARTGALPALEDFHNAMALLERDAREPLDFAPVGEASIREDEAVLISLWRGLTVDGLDTVCATLALLVDEEGVAPLLFAMSQASARLAAVGFDLSGLTTLTEKEVK